MRNIVRQVSELYVSVEDEKKTMQENWSRQIAEQNSLKAQTNTMSAQMVRGLETIFDVSTGGFMQPKK